MGIKLSEYVLKYLTAYLDHLELVLHFTCLHRPLTSLHSTMKDEAWGAVCKLLGNSGKAAGSCEVPLIMYSVGQQTICTVAHGTILYMP